MIGIRMLENETLKLELSPTEDRRGILALMEDQIIGGGIFIPEMGDANPRPVAVYGGWAVTDYRSLHWASCVDVTAMLIVDVNLVRAVQATLRRFALHGGNLIRYEQLRRQGTLDAIRELAKALPAAIPEESKEA